MENCCISASSRHGSRLTERTVPEPDWAVLLDAAGLGGETLRPVEPTWTPDVHTDSRVAWEGRFPHDIDLPIRVEAGAFRGRPVYFELFFPWETPPDQPDTHSDSWTAVGRHVIWWTFTITLIFVAFFARRNARLDRCDRKAARRVAMTLIVLYLALWLLNASPRPGCCGRGPDYCSTISARSSSVR